MSFECLHNPHNGYNIKKPCKQHSTINWNNKTITLCPSRIRVTLSKYPSKINWLCQPAKNFILPMKDRAAHVSAARRMHCIILYTISCWTKSRHTTSATSRMWPSTGIRFSKSTDLRPRNICWKGTTVGHRLSRLQRHPIRIKLIQHPPIPRTVLRLWGRSSRVPPW